MGRRVERSSVLSWRHNDRWRTRAGEGTAVVTTSELRVPYLTVSVPQGGFRAAVMNAVVAATERSQELRGPARL